MTRRTKQQRALIDQIKMIDGRISFHQIRINETQAALDELSVLRRQLADALQEAGRGIQR